MKANVGRAIKPIKCSRPLKSFFYDFEIFLKWRGSAVWITAYRGVPLSGGVMYWHVAVCFYVILRARVCVCVLLWQRRTD